MSARSGGIRPVARRPRPPTTRPSRLEAVGDREAQHAIAQRDAAAQLLAQLTLAVPAEGYAYVLGVASAQIDVLTARVSQLDRRRGNAAVDLVNSARELADAARVAHGAEGGRPRDVAGLDGAPDINGVPLRYSPCHQSQLLRPGARGARDRSRTIRRPRSRSSTSRARARRSSRRERLTAACSIRTTASRRGRTGSPTASRRSPSRSGCPAAVRWTARDVDRRQRHRLRQDPRGVHRPRAVLRHEHAIDLTPDQDDLATPTAPLAGREAGDDDCCAGNSLTRREAVAGRSDRGARRQARGVDRQVRAEHASIQTNWPVCRPIGCS